VTFASLRLGLLGGETFARSRLGYVGSVQLTWPVPRLRRREVRGGPFGEGPRTAASDQRGAFDNRGGVRTRARGGCPPGARFTEGLPRADRLRSPEIEGDVR